MSRSDASNSIHIIDIHIFHFHGELTLAFYYIQNSYTYQQRERMVLWEITLGTAYFLGLKRTYKLALRIQRRLVGPTRPKIRQFLQRKTRSIFDVALKVHREVQQRDIEVGRNLDAFEASLSSFPVGSFEGFNMSFQDIEAGRPLNSRRAGYTGMKPQDPTQAIASGIFQINTAVSTFQRLVNTLGTPKDTPELREKLHKTRLHIGQLVKDTSEKLKQASETDHRAEVSASKKITDAKLAKDFQAVLKEFQKAQRLAAERETAYSPAVPQAIHSSRNEAGEVDASSGRSPEQHALLVQSKRQEVLLLDNEIAFNEAIIEERDQGIQEIQNQIGEVNEIFKDLAVLVHEQGTMIDDIGSNIENSHAATLQGKSHLAKASKTQRSNSSMTCLLMVILGIVLLIVIIILVV
ncbi:unnamed protein product [Lactuca saligna]|uniref:t-SNARE coiled-coil homology domain-containing protein n=1 Tax=Lactuca saligna TaxID=75948 RepID=A0AA36ECJ2_LACSI|nr:unnamed protein product [Lactuca saligna]